MCSLKISLTCELYEQVNIFSFVVFAFFALDSRALQPPTAQAHFNGWGFRVLFLYTERKHRPFPIEGG